MTRQTPGLEAAIAEYMRAAWSREPEILARLRRETARLGRVAGMQISPEQGQLMGLLVELIGARQALEVGTFTGYSALAVALALPADGRLITCDTSREWTAIAQRYWDEAGVAGRIELRLGPGLATLRELQREGAAGSFDFAFVDADKENYAAYCELALDLLRPGGLLLFDNVFWGRFADDPQRRGAEPTAIDRLNAKLRRDERVTLAIVPLGDGVTLARKRP
jgi:caffeoyl-CoA O-methyltransferase